jgi:hypothetical protein
MHGASNETHPIMKVHNSITRQYNYNEGPHILWSWSTLSIMPRYYKGLYLRKGCFEQVPPDEYLTGFIHDDSTFHLTVASNDRASRECGVNDDQRVFSSWF